MKMKRRQAQSSQDSYTQQGKRMTVFAVLYSHTKLTTRLVRAQLSGTGINHVDYIIRGSADAWNAVFNADTGATIKDVKFYILGYVIEKGSVNYFLGENTSNDITTVATTSYNLATNK